MLDDAALAPDPDRRAAVERALTQIAGPGAVLVASDRLLAADVARRSWAGEGLSFASPLERVASAVATDTEGIDQEFIADLEVQGMNRLTYLEIAGIVARLSTVDWYARGIGAAPPPLGTPSDEPPTANVAADAAITDSWVPMTSEASAPRTLDALPDEGEALRSLLEPTYIPMAKIGDWSAGDSLTRPQIELVASRTSYLNECFY